MIPHTPPAAGSGSDFARTCIDRVQARSMVMSSLGIVASEHPLASQAGATILARGGHAVDAAIAANAVMGVVAPMMNGVGGDLFAIVREASTGRLRGVNASGWAPSGLTIDVLNAAGCGTMPRTGIHAVTVPGAVGGWDLLRSRFGRVPFADLLAPAIAIAAEGFPVAEICAAEWAGSEHTVRGNPEASKTYLPHGRAPQSGEIFRNPDLAWTYRQIAARGREAFYNGEIAGRIIECSQDCGGTLRPDDLSDFDAEWVEPLTTTYREWSVYELPPNGQGIAALMMLNILEYFPLRKFGHNSADALHALIEAKNLAYADLDRHVGDPRVVSVPAAAMLSKAYARARAGSLDPARAQPNIGPGTLPDEGGDTTYLSVVDREGNMVSLIQSNFANFGSGIVPRGTGFALQNRGGLFTLDASHPNALAPRKRPLHTIIPGFMQRDEVHVAFGIMGGWNQAQAHAQFVSNIVDHGMNVQAALEAPRVTKLALQGSEVIVEDRIPSSVRDDLERRGHSVQVHGAYSSMVGGGQSVMHDRSTGVNSGGSDPRKDGAAIPEPVGA